MIVRKVPVSITFRLCRRFNHSLIINRLQQLSTDSHNTDKVSTLLRYIDESKLASGRAGDNDNGNSTSNIPLTTTAKLEIGRLLDELIVSDTPSLVELKRSLKRLYTGYSYRILSDNLVQLSKYPELLKMSLYRYLGKDQYAIFTRNLQTIIESSDATSVQEKKQRIYDLIHLQYTLFSSSRREYCITLPDTVHKWFSKNLSRDELFGHCLFLIKNRVSLSSSPHIQKLIYKLLRGSELERQLVTFEFFLRKQDFSIDREILDRFVSIYNFNDLVLIFNSVVRTRKPRLWDNAELNGSVSLTEFYLQALTQKLVLYRERGSSARGSLNEERKKLAKRFVQFTDELLFLLADRGELTLFMSVFKLLVAFIRENASTLSPQNPTSVMNLLHRPIIYSFKLLRTNEAHDLIFTLVSTVSQLPFCKTHQFKTRLVYELARSLRYFNDPKLLCQFVVSAIKRPDPAALLNDLGIWGAVFHSDATPLPRETLQRDLESINRSFPNGMRTDLDRPAPVLNEVYRTLLTTSSVVMTPLQYRMLLVQLYVQYKATLNKSYKSHYMWKQTSGIINRLVSEILYTVKDPKLAYNTLLDFYSQQFADKIKTEPGNCPFSTVLYGSRKVLTPLEVSQILRLMETLKIPLTFKACVAMIFINLSRHKLSEAHTWYKKILIAGFDIRHHSLIEVAKKYSWELPANVDTAVPSDKPGENLMEGTDIKVGDIERNAVEPEDETTLLLDAEEEDKSDERELVKLIHSLKAV